MFEGGRQDLPSLETLPDVLPVIPSYYAGLKLDGTGSPAYSTAGVHKTTTPKKFYYSGPQKRLRYSDGLNPVCRLKKVEK